MTTTFFQLIGNPDYQHKYVLERIVSHIMGWTREDLVTHYDDEVGQKELSEINSLYNRYALDNYPLEYILGYVEYGGLRFKVTQDTIIPRPETEFMIEVVREHLDFEQGTISNGKLTISDEQLEILANPKSNIQHSKLVLVDVGTGSGVLGLSIVSSHGAMIDQVYLADVSQPALDIARGNYKKLMKEGKIDENRKIDFVLGNLFDREQFDTLDEQSDIVITANLPYIPDEDFDTNPDRTIKHEPRLAFVGGEDGLDLYREMFEQIRDFVSSGAKQSEVERSLHKVTMFLEMMTRQVDILRQEFDWLAFEEVRTFHANIRIVKVEI